MEVNLIAREISCDALSLDVLVQHFRRYQVVFLKA